MKNWLLNVFNLIAGSASIVGVFCLFFSDERVGGIALLAFCVFLALLLISTWIGLIKFIQKENPEKYKKISAFTSYETSDGIQGVYEVFKVIQSKRLILQTIEHNFKWTGTKQPELSSNLQEIKQVVYSNDNSYDTALLSLRKPLKYNEAGTIHVKAVTDDFDHAAHPHLDYKVNSEINVILFRVTLKNKTEHFNKPAKLLKKQIESDTPVDYQLFGSVPFDGQSKSYQYYLTEPEIGYYYRLEWEK